MTPPDFLQECAFLFNFPRTFHVDAAEDVGEFVNTLLHAQELSGGRHDCQRSHITRE
jgi:hypothetical protein